MFTYSDLKGVEQKIKTKSITYEESRDLIYELISDWFHMYHQVENLKNELDFRSQKAIEVVNKTEDYGDSFNFFGC